MQGKISLASRISTADGDSQAPSIYPLHQILQWSTSNGVIDAFQKGSRCVCAEAKPDSSPSIAIASAGVSVVDPDLTKVLSFQRQPIWHLLPIYFTSRPTKPIALVLTLNWMK